jgi:DNA-binding Lrp family transcriptional regulator
VIHRYDPGTATRGIGMAISAYVLIQTEVGKAARVASAARAIDGVVAADDVTGPYDVIVRTEAPSLDDLGRLVVSQIQAVEGITRTFTCPVVNL